MRKENSTKNRVGEIRKSNQCGLMKIVEYNNARDITVKFKTGSIIKAEYSNFKKGKVKDPLFPSVYGIGYVGIGKFKTAINYKMTIGYKIWKSMIQRCYEPYCINKQPTYQDATVCKKWWNFQTFAEWHNKNYYELLDERVELDKDLIKKGNKIYSPEFCSFVPQSINTLLIKCDKSRGKYPIGVYFHKSSNKYTTKVNMNGKRKHLGLFSTPNKAFNVYKEAKENQIKIMVNKYKDVLDIHVFDSLMKYQVEITD